MLGVSDRTLRYRVTEKYGKGIDEVRAERQGPMRQKLFASMWRSATSGSVQAQIWLSKNLLNWRDKAELTSSVGSGEKLVINMGDGDGSERGFKTASEASNRNEDQSGKAIEITPEGAVRVISGSVDNGGEQAPVDITHRAEDL